MTDNVAILEGYTEQFTADCGEYVLNILVKPYTDLDSSFSAWDMDEQEFITINGWLFSFESIASE